MDPILNSLAGLINNNEDLEGMVRPMLGLLETITGLESTYLTTIDSAQGVQRILFSRNSSTLNIPEGLAVVWDDTLCKRSLEEGRTYTDNVAALWGDSDAARELGITTYLSQPVRVADGELYGTLCGASNTRVRVSPEAQRLMLMFSELIARQVERERLLDRLRRENQEFEKTALTDPLTGIPNRRGLLSALGKALSNAARAETALHLAFIDLDGFKAINDTLGHDAGDRFLMEIARVLQEGLRQGDYVARIGGDEFVVFGQPDAEDLEGSRQRFADRLAAITRGHFFIGTTTLDYAGPSIGVITASGAEHSAETALAAADAAMYRVKQARKRGDLH